SDDWVVALVAALAGIARRDRIDLVAGDRRRAERTEKQHAEGAAIDERERERRIELRDLGRGERVHRVAIDPRGVALAGERDRPAGELGADLDDQRAAERRADRLRDR